MKIKRSRLSVRFNTVFFPLSPYELTGILTEAGYVLQQQLPSPPPGVPGARLDVSGTLATRGDTSIEVDTLRGVLGLATDWSKLISEFEEALSLIEPKLFTAIPQISRYFESIIDGRKEFGGNVIQELSTLFQDIPWLNSLNKLWDSSLTNFGLRLVPQNSAPNSDEWMDIRIEPDIISSNAFVFSVVYRSPEKENVFSFIHSLEERLNQTFYIIQRRQK